MSSHVYGGGRDRPTPHQLETKLQHDEPHGQPGHRGVKCYECAQMSGKRTQIAPNSGDYWQTKQIEWQEACDKIFRAFDDSVAAHFPEHVPGAQNCGCPEKPKLPPKPVQPRERALGQL